MKVLKKKNHVEKNPIGLSDSVSGELIPQLDSHLATMFSLFHQYQKHHWVVEGPQFRDLHLFFGEAYEEVHKQCDRVAERITAIGGIPTSSPAGIASLSYNEHEPEGTFPIREMMTRDLDHEGAIAVKLRETIQAARDLGDPGTAQLLTEVLLEVEDRAHHLDHFLGNDSLEIGRKG